jgi:hypothetical protein
MDTLIEEQQLFQHIINHIATTQDENTILWTFPSNTIAQLITPDFDIWLFIHCAATTIQFTWILFTLFNSVLILTLFIKVKPFGYAFCSWWITSSNGSQQIWHT